MAYCCDGNLVTKHSHVSRLWINEKLRQYVHQPKRIRWTQNFDSRKRYIQNSNHFVENNHLFRKFRLWNCQSHIWIYGTRAHDRQIESAPRLEHALRWRFKVNIINLFQVHLKAHPLCWFHRAVNNDLLDTYQLKSLDGLLEAEVEGITLERRGGKLWVRFNNSMDMEMASDADSFALREGYDDVISCLGFKFDSTIFHRSVQIALIRIFSIDLTNH